VIRH